MKKRLSTLFALAATTVIALAGPAPAAADPVRATSSIEPRVVGAGERVRFTIAVEGPGLTMPRLRPRFDPGDLVVVAGPDVTHGLTLGSGGGWRYSWSWWLEATSEGPAAVTGVHVLVGDRELDLPSRRIEVVSQPIGGVAPPRGRLDALGDVLEKTRERIFPGEDAEPPPDAFLRAVASPERPFVGERVVYTVYLYNRRPVRSCTADSLPSFQGLWARPVDLPRSGQEMVEWEGEMYQRTPILRKELYALAARPHQIEPLRARLVVETIERDRSFFFPVRKPRTILAESNPVDLDVRPLPTAGHGDGGRAFEGAVGPVAVAAHLRPAETRIGQSTTLTVTIVGEGHLESLSAPRLEPRDGIDALGPQAVAGDPAANAGKQRSWEYLLVPRRAGSWELPPVEVPYFDPETERYLVARATLPELVVRPAPAERADGSAGGGVAGSIRPIRSAALPAPGLWSGGWRSTLPWALAVPSLATLVLLLARRRPRGGSGAGLPRRHLDEALRADHPRRSAAAIERAWRDFLAEALGVPEAVPAARWPDEALARGADRPATRELRTLVDDLHYLRFAPELSETGSLAAEIVARSERVARALAP